MNNDNDLLEYFTKEELDDITKDLKYIENHIEEYRTNNNWEDLKKKY